MKSQSPVKHRLLVINGLVMYYSPLQLPDGAPPRGPLRQPGGGGAAGGAGGGPQQGRQGRGHAPGFSKQVSGDRATLSVHLCTLYNCICL